jgi:formylglycine-generating enzyme required for sulfatase activity
MYPAGATLGQAAIWDMAGTLWEWCLNKFDRSEESRSHADNFDSRVLRGGSWDGGQGYARSASRRGSRPLGRGYSVGFRVVCVAHL